MYWIIVVFCGVLSLLSIENVYAESVRLDEVVVTATRTEEEINKIPANVTVISREDIEKSTASTVPDLFRNEEGLVISDYYGTGTKSKVSMRGFDQGNNTLILLDGRRLNEIDSGEVDWNLIPLEHVERIEIVRGSETVLYGDNAMAGVINIITRKGKVMMPVAEIETRIESYDGDTEHISLRGGTEKMTYFLFAKQRETEGYRDNSEFNANDLNAKLGFNISERLFVDFSGTYHTDHQGYPGGLSKAELESDRTQTITPDDVADYEQYFYGTNLRYNSGEWGDIEVEYNFNSRKFDASYISMAWNMKRDINTDETKLKFTTTPTFFNHKNLLVIGVDRYNAKMDDNTSDISKTDYGYYLQEEFFFNDKLSLNLGYRYGEAEIKDTVNGDKDFFKSAIKTGITYNYKKYSKGFISYSKGYRLPTIDDLGLAAEGLKPEEADTYEIGSVYTFNDRLEVRLTIYDMKIKNEIRFVPNATPPFYGVNDNLEKTEHKGVELGFSTNLHELLSIFGNWTYNDATFESDPYKGNRIPLIPQQSINIGGNIKLIKHYLVTLKGNWVSERYLDGDFGNNADRLPDFMTFDTKLSYENKRVNVYIGANNIFDKEYVEYGNVWGALYPVPNRNYYCGIKVSF